jgi:hypothetical protein
VVDERGYKAELLRYNTRRLKEEDTVSEKNETKQQIKILSCFGLGNDLLEEYMRTIHIRKKNA